MKIRSLLACLSLLAVAALTPAQVMLRPKMGVNIQILSLPAVHKELKLTEDQGKAATSLSKSLQDKARFQVSGGDMEEIRRQLDEQAAEFAADARKQIKALLSEEAYKRYLQLSLQSLGLDAFDVKEAAQALKLTSSQRRVLEEQAAVVDELTQTLYAASAEHDGDQVKLKLTDAQEKEMSDAMTKARNAVIKTFTPEQLKAWEELTGPVFNFKPPRSA